MHNDFGALSTPIFQTSTFVFDSAKQGGRRFAGSGERLHLRPSRQPHHQPARAENRAAGGRRGCTEFSSGMGAISATPPSLLSCGDHLWQTKRSTAAHSRAFIHETLPRFGIHANSIDMTDMAQVKSSHSPGHEGRLL
ncbi:MAG: PLP-dependent transferase [Oscillospiraceae bacterium]